MDRWCRDRLSVQYITGADPAADNTASNATLVSIKSETSANPVTVPPYCVIRIDLNTPALLTPVNAASYAAGPVAPEEIVSVFGPGIATQTAVAGSLPLPTSLAGTQIQLTDSTGNSQLAPQLAVAPGQANFLFPRTLTSGVVKIAVLHGAVVALTGSVTIGPSSPGIFTANGDGAGAAAANVFRVTGTNQIVDENGLRLQPTRTEKLSAFKARPRRPDGYALRRDLRHGNSRRSIGPMLRRGTKRARELCRSVVLCRRGPNQHLDSPFVGGKRQCASVRRSGWIASNAAVLSL